MDKFGGGKPGLPAGARQQPLRRGPARQSFGRRQQRKVALVWVLDAGRRRRRALGQRHVRERIREGRGRLEDLAPALLPAVRRTGGTGWKAYTGTLPLVPYHFKTEDEAGTPIPAAVGPAPRTDATLASLEQRVDALNAEDKARNLQNAYGYYIDRKMWDDVTDLFTADGVLEIGGIGIYDGPANIRRALERNGPAGLKHGQLNDHPLFDTTIEIAPGGLEARVRGLELGHARRFQHAAGRTGRCACSQPVRQAGRRVEDPRNARCSRC